MEPLEDLLPNISIKVDTSLNDFISKMAEIAKSFPEIEYRKNKECDESALSLSLTFKKADQYGLENLYGLFWPWVNKRVLVELSSTTWAISPPSYEQYVQLTKQLMGPFLTSYNKRYKTRCRFRIPKKEQLEPKLSPVIERVFNRFVSSANKSFLNFHDWQNFYSFVRLCHRQRTNLTTGELERLLLRAGFSKYYAKELSCIYEHGRGILRKEFFPEHIQRFRFHIGLTITNLDSAIPKRRSFTCD